MIEYCRLTIDYLRSAFADQFIKRPIKKMTERSDSFICQ
jgi:hypothetical protein